MKKDRFSLYLGICLLSTGILLFLLSFYDYMSRHRQVDYIINVVDDSVVLYDYNRNHVGTVKLEGQLDSLITIDNQ